MKKSPIYPKHEAGDYSFNPHLDFSEFLEEARKHACKDNNFVAASPDQDKTRKKQLDEGKKSKKSWKKSLFSWWKVDKKSNPIMEPPTNSSQTAKPRRGHGHVSGPIYGSGGGANLKPRRPISGPLTSFFHSTKRVENEIPYMCLDQPNSPHGVQSYGPVYLVT